MTSEIGLIGLGVMGKSLARNLVQKGFAVSIYNRNVPGSEEQVAEAFRKSYIELESTLSFEDLKAFVQSLARPRKIILMVSAGSAIDDILNQLEALTEPGDIVVDAGNSHFQDTTRRIAEAEKKGMIFIGAGISGGEQGALLGPSIMPSGSKDGYAKVQTYLEAIAAKDSNGDPCCAYIGTDGSGHFVKMIHNGIEYVEMQLLAECYFIMKTQGLPNDEIAEVLESWRENLDSYLLEITVKILLKKEGDGFLLDKIVDNAGNKGTGNWTTISIVSSGVPATLIPSALLARYMSFFKEMRVKLSQTFPVGFPSINLDLSELKSAYHFARIINHQQGFSLINRVSEQNDWRINLSETARIWTGGCIIKSDLMKEMVDYLKADSDIFKHEAVVSMIRSGHNSAKLVSAECLRNEIHAPCLIEAVNYFHGAKTANSAANMIQAQRDYFGAHTYQRIDDPSGHFHHTRW